MKPLAPLPFASPFVFALVLAAPSAGQVSSDAGTTSFPLGEYRLGHTTSAGKSAWQGPRESWDEARADARPPAAVRYADLAAHEEWLLQVRADHHEFDGLRDRRDDISSSQIFGQGYTHAPTEMTRDRVEFLLLYGLQPETSVFAELPWTRQSMDIETVGGGTLETDNQGLGDVKLGVVHDLSLSEFERLRGTFGVSIPTGSVDETDRDENGNNIRLPYVMQNGTGTFDLHPGLTWTRQYDDWSWGAQGLARFHLGRNDEDWARSDEGEVSIWAARPFHECLSGSVRARGVFWGDVHKGDANLDPDRNPLEDNTRQGGERYELIGGLNWRLDDANHVHRTLSLEVGFPVDEWLDGPGLASEFWAVLAWRHSF